MTVFVDVLAGVGAFSLLVLIALLIYGIIKLRAIVASIKAARGMYGLYKMMRKPAHIKKEA